MFFALGIEVRSGPPFPPWPVAPWHVEQFEAKISWPAAAFPADALLLGVSPACSTPLPLPGAGAGPSPPSSAKSQRSSPCSDPG
jgi:hypothetical protein